MKNPFLSLRRQWIEALLAAALGALSVQLYLARAPAYPTHSEMMLKAEQGDADMSLRNSGFPNTFISTIHLDLTSPNHSVRLVWSGPQATSQDTGPYHSSPGRGNGDCDCNDLAESLRNKSNCTPKGTRTVEAFSDYMGSATAFKFVTWFHANREIAFHSHPQVPDHPASLGCVRLNEHAAPVVSGYKSNSFSWLGSEDSGNG
ncbi:MAG: hypothetical protein L0228_02360 [Planctomycetes bacterium]|nr:hypothetical protein [Planctomycetota bacterium]